MGIVRGGAGWNATKGLFGQWLSFWSSESHQGFFCFSVFFFFRLWQLPFSFNSAVLHGFKGGLLLLRAQVSHSILKIYFTFTSKSISSDTSPDLKSVYRFLTDPIITISYTTSKSPSLAFP